MTVAGKGGRPRKWRSDADRARAYRARQRGLTEPEELASVVDECDSLAVAWRHVDDLGSLVRELREPERALRSEIRHLEGELEVERSRVRRLERVNAALRDELRGAEETNEQQRRLQRELVDERRRQCT
jgi:chromosome segregation ATPase